MKKMLLIITLLSMLIINVFASFNDIDICDTYSKEACENGNMKECVGLGKCYFEDISKKENFIKAKDFFKKACDSNYYRGCEELSNIYKKKQDNKLVFTYAEKACSIYDKLNLLDKKDITMLEIIEINSGNGNCLFLANSYRKGIYVKQDYNMSLTYLDMAGKSGLYYNKLAKRFILGENIKQDYNKGIAYYKKSCKLKYMESCNTLGSMYRDGNIIKKNISKAKSYYAISCEYENKKGCEQYSILNKKERKKLKN